MVMILVSLMIRCFSAWPLSVNVMRSTLLRYVECYRADD